MGTFFTNAENNPCVVQESISLEDCLACSGCISPDEANAFAPDLSFLHTTGISPIFVISPQSKQSMYSHFRPAPYRVFESALIACLHRELRSPLILDTSYFAKSPENGPISSECPAVVLYIERVFPALVPLLSTELSYQQLAVSYAADWICSRERTDIHNSSSRYKIVAVMQCYDKKDENGRDGTLIDYFLGAKDLFNHIKDRLNLDESYRPEVWEISHGYPDQEVSGRENVVNILKGIKAGTRPALQRLELRICKGGCMGGPAQASTADYSGKYTEVEGNRLHINPRSRVFRVQKRRTFNVEW